MKYFWGGCLVLFTICQSTIKANSCNTKSPNPELQAFVEGFMAVVKTKKVRNILPFIDAEYKHNQHDLFLKGNTTQFIDELFGGYIKGTTTWKNTKLKKIKSIELETLGSGIDFIPVTFRVRTRKTITSVDLFINVVKVKDKIVYGIVGAVG